MTVVRRAAGAGVRKPPREETAGGGRGCRGLGYGDFSAADEVGEWSRGAPASRWMVNRLLDERGGGWNLGGCRGVFERRVASNSVSCRTICDDRRMSGRVLPWPVERQRV